MSVHVMSRVCEHSQQRGALRLLLIALADGASPDGLCRPNIDHLAGYTNESKATCAHLLRQLEAIGEIAINEMQGMCAILVGLSSTEQDAVLRALRMGRFSVDRPRMPTGYIKQPIPRRIRVEVFTRDAHQCKHCGCKDDLTIDHIIPEVAGGTLDLDNLQTLCRPCNSRKGAR